MTNSGRRNKTVVFICGAGHSGTTLLGLMLGAHPAVCFAGEAWNSTRLGTTDAHGRTVGCNFCADGCPVWGSPLPPPGPDLYEVLARRSGRSFAVDSTKAVGWIDQQAALLPGAVQRHLVMLARDGRAVVNSGLRKYPDARPAELASEWVAQIRRTEDLAARWPGTVSRLHYEDLATHTKDVLSHLSATLGLSFLPAMLDFWASVQHPLGGNEGTQHIMARERALRTADRTVALDRTKRAYYLGHPPTIVLDLRWREEMSESALRAFDAIAGETNAPYAR
ncbi:sulfotransferase family protein [Streptomyces rhizosphaerihabitans]|uniref:sulfotransferase family protein n=1 Tax=Streptomyces rhizosphaerihabitans TaxID=1266770 RepID=UPI0021BFFF49|nr:sulfotransferase [Streptomyces rhizosphaerihabitans]MCT9011628.1 sulfotransferase [Streptomyces rhizosphaerihabitans]